MVKIFKLNELNESYGNWTTDELTKFVDNISTLKEGLRRYIIWKENISDDPDEDIFVKEVTLNSNIWVEYWDSVANEYDYEIKNINELVKFLNDPQFYIQQDKYNL